MHMHFLLVGRFEILKTRFFADLNALLIVQRQYG